MSEFLAMGGYAVYVWSTFAISALALAATVIFIKRQLRRTRTQVQRWLQSREGQGL